MELYKLKKDEYLKKICKILSDSQQLQDGVDRFLMELDQIKQAPKELISERSQFLHEYCMNFSLEKKNGF